MQKLHEYRLLSWICAACSLLAFALLLADTYRFDNKYTAGPPYGEDGVFSFSESDLTKPIPLVDGWLLDGREVFIGQYSNFSFLPGRDSPFGEGTYTLTLRYEGPPRTLLLELPQVFTEYTLYVNQRPTASTGSGAVIDVPVGGGDTGLRLETVNRSHYYSGLTYPPMLGTAEAIGQMSFLRTLVYSAAVVSALTLAIFSLSLWFSRERDGLFLHFGVLCLAFAVHCLHPFVWQLGLSGTLWYAVEDASWLLALCEAAAVAAVASGLRRNAWYRRLLRPAALFVCILSMTAVLFIIPAAPGFVKFYGGLMDGAKLLIWAFLALCAGTGLGGEKHGAVPFVLAAAGILGVSLFADFWDANKFEPIYGLWQEEYAGAALVLAFGGLMVRRNARLLRESAELQAMKLQNRFAADSAAQMRGAIEQARALKHELRHHVETMTAFYQAEEYVRLGAYLAELDRQKEELPQLYYTENFLVNAILSGRLGPAGNAGIRIECEVRVPENLPIADADLCMLLSNLLDNAVEACERLPAGSERFISLSLAVRQGVFLVICQNSAPPRNTGSSSFLTSKPDAGCHGLGIPTMRRVTEKYDGALELRQLGSVFTLQAALRLPPENH